MSESVSTFLAGVEPAYVDEKVAARIVAMSVSKLQKLRAAGDGSFGIVRKTCIHSCGPN